MVVKAVFASMPVAVSALRLFIYPLPNCSADIKQPEDGAHTSLTALHEVIAKSRFVTADPAEASLFYAPLHFFFSRLGLPSDSSPQACMQSMRQQIEQFAWVHRRHGSDHFFLVDGRRDSLAGLEHFWPALSNFMLLASSEYLDVNTFCQDADASQRARCFSRTLVVPPLSGSFDGCCGAHVREAQPRLIRIAYDGPLQSGGVAHTAIQHAASSIDMKSLQLVNQVHFLLSNLTSTSQQTSLDQMVVNLPQLEMWSKAQACLVLPQDAGFELRLYYIIAAGCIPVIIRSPGHGVPALPLLKSLRWQELAIFWDLNHSRLEFDEYYGFGAAAWRRAALQLLLQLVALGGAALTLKQQALQEERQRLRWSRQSHCGTSSPCSTAIDLVISELEWRRGFNVNDNADSLESWWKDSVAQYFEFSNAEDLTGNGCHAGYPSCESHSGDVYHGDVCRAFVHGVGWSCPGDCKYIDGPPYCAMSKEVELLPCRVSECKAGSVSNVIWISTSEFGASAVSASSKVVHDLPEATSHLIKDDMKQHVSGTPRFALVSFSDRPQVRALTWKSLRRFSSAHPGRYHLRLEVRPLLVDSYLHPAWNKFALIQQTLLTGNYDAVVWIDDDVFITKPSEDPIYEAIMDKLLPDDDKVLIASLDEHVSARVPLNSGMLVMKNCSGALHLLDELFQIGTPGNTYVINNTWLQPSMLGYWDQDAFAVYVSRHGSSEFVLMEHRTLQSFVRPGSATWQPGDFAAHLTGTRNPKQRWNFMKQFAMKLPNLTWKSAH